MRGTVLLKIAFAIIAINDALGFKPSSPLQRTGVWNVRGVTSHASALRLSAAASDIGRKRERASVPFPLTLWRFTRPHTLIGSAIAIPALHAQAAPTLTAIFRNANLVSTVYAAIPALLMNLYITGLNQITDVEIDKVNKPNLPIPAGELSEGTAVGVVLVALLLSLWLGVAHPVLGTQGLNVALWGSCILGTLYSLPPFRLKRFPALAAFCIVAVRGTIINAGFFAHAQSAAFGVPVISVLHTLLTERTCMLTNLFFGVFGVVIALMKDVPDVEGDEIARVRTFSVRLGQKSVFRAMRQLLTSLFFVFGAGFIRGAFNTPQTARRLCRATLGLSAVVAGLFVNKAASTVDPYKSDEVYGYYMKLWKLFYLSYLALPFAR